MKKKKLLKKTIIGKNYFLIFHEKSSLLLTNTSFFPPPSAPSLPGLSNDMLHYIFKCQETRQNLKKLHRRALDKY